MEEENMLLVEIIIQRDLAIAATMESLQKAWMISQYDQGSRHRLPRERER
jgi:hypothetical protein